MIHKTSFKILTTSMMALLANSSIIPANASQDEAGTTSKQLRRVKTTPERMTKPFAAPGYVHMGTKLILEPISEITKDSDEKKLGHPRKKVKTGQNITEVIKNDAEDLAIPLSQPTAPAGFIRLGEHQNSQIGDANTQAAINRLEISIMKSEILPALDDLLELKLSGQPAPRLPINEELLTIVEKLASGKPKEASDLANILLIRVNAHESTEGPIDEFSRLGLYAVQAVLHLLAGTPYEALNNFLELRQLGISWYPHKQLKGLFCKPGDFYHYLNQFVSSAEAASIWGEAEKYDERIRKLWQGHTKFAWDQEQNDEIITYLEGLGDVAGEEGELTFLHTLYVLGKMQLHQGRHKSSVPSLEASQITLSKISSYRFKNLFSYRNAAIEVFLGDARWFRAQLGGDESLLSEALDHYTHAVSLIEPEKGLGADMIRNSFNHLKEVIPVYAASPDVEKIAKLALFREKLIVLASGLPHIDVPEIMMILEAEIQKLTTPLTAVATTSVPTKDSTSAVVTTAPKPKKKSSKKRKGRGDEDEESGEYYDGGAQGEDFLNFYSEYQQPPEKRK
ncbi:MAG: hypothetical protein K2W94_04120 [Alphaproteobacteria bacterium]|nr:hypothetical protein [Alphaproteobacteria bacterium]